MWGSRGESEISWSVVTFYATRMFFFDEASEVQLSGTSRSMCFCLLFRILARNASELNCT